jgi:pimeloyl-ACP methyl ester carboxylesterase
LCCTYFTVSLFFHVLEYTFVWFHLSFHMPSHTHNCLDLFVPAHGIKSGRQWLSDSHTRFQPHTHTYPYISFPHTCTPHEVLAGSDDLIREEHTRKIASFIPHSEVLIVPGEGHGSYISHSDKLYFIVKPFLDKNVW